MDNPHDDVLWADLLKHAKGTPRLYRALVDLRQAGATLAHNERGGLALCCEDVPRGLWLDPMTPAILGMLDALAAREAA